MVTPLQGLGVECKSTPRAMKVLVLVEKHNRVTKLMQMHNSLPSDQASSGPCQKSIKGQPPTSVSTDTHLGNILQ